MNVLVLIDLVLASLVLGLAIACLTTAHPFRGIVLFIAFGLLVAIVWSRLGAVDVALAEAAIGAGLTGALLMSAWRAIEASSDEEERPDD